MLTSTLYSSSIPYICTQALLQEISLQEKEKGNALVKESKFVEAKAAYDEAIRRNPKDHTLYR